MVLYGLEVFELGPAIMRRGLLLGLLRLSLGLDSGFVRPQLSFQGYRSSLDLIRPLLGLGFLPGDLSEKIDPYLRPLYDALEDMLPMEKLESYMEKNIIEVIPLAYMRGRTLNNAFVILDEAQNSTTLQMKMFLTRLGPNSKSIITGDVTQIDLPKRDQSGLVQIQQILQNIDDISFLYFEKSDVVRHKLVKDIIDAYEKFQGQ